MYIHVGFKNNQNGDILKATGLNSRIVLEKKS